MKYHARSVQRRGGGKVVSLHFRHAHTAGTEARITYTLPENSLRYINSPPSSIVRENQPSDHGYCGGAGLIWMVAVRYSVKTLLVAELFPQRTDTFLYGMCACLNTLREPVHLHEAYSSSVTVSLDKIRQLTRQEIGRREKKDRHASMTKFSFENFCHSTNPTTSLFETNTTSTKQGIVLP